MKTMTRGFARTTAIGAALVTTAVVLAQGGVNLYLPNITKNSNGLPAPTPTAPPPGSCGPLLNATTLTGPFSFSFVGSDQFTFDDGYGHTQDLTASVHRTYSSTLTLANRTADVDGVGNILSVNWDVTALTNPVIGIDDAWTEVVSGPPVVTYESHAVGGTPYSTGVEGYLTLFADCTYMLTVWPWANQTIGGVATHDNVFRFDGAYVPATSSTLLSANIQAPTYNAAQSPSSNRPLYTADLSSANTVGGNGLALELLRAEKGTAVLSGQYAETSTIAWSFSPAP